MVGDPPPAGFTAERADHLQALSVGHFWFEPRSLLVRRRIDAALSVRPNRALELGCGSGAFLPHLAARADQVWAVEGHRQSLELALARAPAAKGLGADLERPLPWPDECFDLLVALDVLEHLDAERLLREAARVACPKAVLVVTVPAMPSLWSELDAAAGHQRRYTRTALIDQLERCGWQVEASTHYQLIVLPLVWWSRRLAGRRGVGLERRPPRWVDSALRAINTLEVKALGGLSLPIGSSVLATARKGAA